MKNTKAISAKRANRKMCTGLNLKTRVIGDKTKYCRKFKYKTIYT